MNLRERLFEIGKPYWDKIIEQDFIKELSEGTLDEEIYRYYTLQDNSYLEEFVKVFAIGISKSNNLEDMKNFLRFMKGAMESETDAHDAFLEKIGITKEMSLKTQANIVNTSYTNYMISVASTGTAAEAAAAVLTCNWSYQYIAEKTKDKEGYKNTFYCKDWYDIYTSDYFKKDVEDNIAMVEKLCANYTEKQIKHIEDIIKICSEYEYLFWDISYNKGKKVENIVC